MHPILKSMSRYAKTSKNVFQIRLLSTSDSIEHLIKPITVRTGVGNYAKLIHQYPGKFPINIPTDGIDLTVEYADSADRLSKMSDFDKVIVAIPGTPGYHVHFDQLIKHYRNTRVRVIAPNLPDFGHTISSGSVYWHTTAEKVAFLRDFLAQIEVDKIDCLISHSMGFQTVSGLCEDPGNIEIKSLALFSPQPMWDLTPKRRGYLKKLFTFRGDLYYNALSALKLHQAKIWPMKFATINECLWLMATLTDEKASNDAHRRISILKHGKIPVVVQFGTKEPIVQPRSVKKIYREFGVGENLIHLDPSNAQEVEKITRDGPRIKGYMIKDGGHFAYAKHKDYSIKIIDNLLSHYN